MHKAKAVGHSEPLTGSFFYKSDTSRMIGFRPAFPLPHQNLKDGDRIPVATLYMNDEPVRIADDPTWDGDIADYIAGAKLEFRGPVQNSLFDIMAIKAGNAMIADRVILQNVSWADLEKQGFVGTQTVKEEVPKESAADLKSVVVQQQEEIAALKELLRKERAENKVLRARVFELEMERA